jgi:hypothetical protein
MPTTPRVLGNASIGRPVSWAGPSRSRQKIAGGPLFFDVPATFLRKTPAPKPDFHSRERSVFRGTKNPKKLNEARGVASIAARADNGG